MTLHLGESVKDSLPELREVRADVQKQSRLGSVAECMHVQEWLNLVDPDSVANFLVCLHDIVRALEERLHGPRSVTVLSSMSIIPMCVQQRLHCCVTSQRVLVDDWDLDLA